MSLLKQILKPFVEFEEDKSKEPEKKSVNPVARPEVKPVVEEKVEHPLITGASTQDIPPQVNVTRSSSATMLPEHRQYFEKLIDDANATNPLFKGTDFKEFIDSKSDIDNIADEETRYKTAFNLLKRTGSQKKNL